MANWQFILALVTIVITILGASWLHTHQIDKRLEEMSRHFGVQIEEMGRRFDAQIDAVKAQIEAVKAQVRRLEDDIKEIKADLKKLFQPILMK